MKKVRYIHMYMYVYSYVIQNYVPDGGPCKVVWHVVHDYIKF